MPEVAPPPAAAAVVVLSNEQEAELRIRIENEEREKMIGQLKEAIDRERLSIERLQELIAETGAL